MAVRLPTQTALRARAHVLDESPSDYDALLQLVGKRRFVLLGESTHGTAEFYRMRTQITQRLLEEHGFDALAIEGDWPDAYRVNRHVLGGEPSLESALGEFHRFPTWMWRNREVREFVAWLRKRNAARPAQSRAGFYGLDLYSLYRSAEAVIAYLEDIDPGQATAARRLYECLNHVRAPQDYGYAAAAGLRPLCREGAARLLTDMIRKAPQYRIDDPDAAEEQFFAERNAHVVLNAERYYRMMFANPASTWNLRDAHMVETLLALHSHLRATGHEGRIVVWAHNSHLGDARATQMGSRGEWNIGQLLRERVGGAHVLLVGFTTYTGHVTAARDWDHPAERRWVRPARPDSYEHVLRATRLDRFYLPMDPTAASALGGPMLERAIGVIYRPESELESHYFRAVLGAQFDAVFHLDETSAVEPLDPSEHWSQAEPPDMYPSGL